MVVKAGECPSTTRTPSTGRSATAATPPAAALVLNFMRPETRSADGSTPLVAGGPVVPEGQVVQGDFFPLLT